MAGLVHKKLVLAAGLVVFILAGLPLAAQANAAPPPRVIWLLFAYNVAPQPELQGLQLIGCESLACAQPVLLQQWGTCDKVRCLPPPARLGRWDDTLECAGERCRAASRNYEYGYFKLIAQFSDRVRASQDAASLPRTTGEVLAWRVTVQSDGLALVQDLEFQPPGMPQGNFLLWLGLTLLVELVVAASYFHFGVKLEPRRLLYGLGMVFFANLLTYPVVWFFFPSLGQFQPDYVRAAGNASLGLAFIYAAFITLVYRWEGKKRLWGIVLAIGMLPISYVCVILYMLASGYGSYGAPAYGLPTAYILPAAELFAFAAETVLLYLWGRKIITPLQAVTTSVLANSASLLVGLVVLLAA